jgi:MFS-type transporter involved in bile tolerance (Atg22 family)
VPHRGWWLVTSVYLVVDAHLSASELVLVGVAQSLVALVFEVPAGVVADTISRKWSLVVSHALMGTAMIATGLVDRVRATGGHADALGAVVDVRQRRRRRVDHRRAR